MTPITKTRSQAISHAKEVVKQKTDYKRLPNAQVLEAVATCECGQTQAICLQVVTKKKDPMGMTRIFEFRVGYCENCGTDTSKGRIHA